MRSLFDLADDLLRRAVDVCKTGFLPLVVLLNAVLIRENVFNRYLNAVRLAGAEILVNDKKSIIGIIGGLVLDLIVKSHIFDLLNGALTKMEVEVFGKDVLFVVKELCQKGEKVGGGDVGRAVGDVVEEPIVRVSKVQTFDCVLVDLSNLFAQNVLLEYFDMLHVLVCLLALSSVHFAQEFLDEFFCVDLSFEINVRA